MPLFTVVYKILVNKCYTDSSSKTFYNIETFFFFQRYCEDSDSKSDGVWFYNMTTSVNATVNATTNVTVDVTHGPKCKPF